MSNVLVLAGGSPHAHDFDACGAALGELIDGLGHDVRVVGDPDDAAAILDDDPPDALVIDGLWWRMQGALYDRWRAAYAYSTPETTQRCLAEFVRGGGGLLALHAAVICFDDWPEWGDVVGGSWQWGVSSHPPRGEVAARIVARHPVVDELGGELRLVDEIYGDLDVRSDIEVLAVAQRHADDDEQPVVWTHRFGHGRVVFDGFGHDEASIRHEGNAALIGAAITWITGGS